MIVFVYLRIASSVFADESRMSMIAGSLLTVPEGQVRRRDEPVGVGS